MSNILRLSLTRLSLLALGIILAALMSQSDVYAANVNVEVGTGGQRTFGTTPGDAWDGSGNAGTFELVTINVGDTVTFTPWTDFHSVTGCNPNSFWVNCGPPGVAPIGDSDFQNTGFTHGPITFNTAGEFPWLCNVHPDNMRGKVVVVAAAGGIDIEKATNGVDADSPTGPVVPVGDPVTWTYVVTNTGAGPLASVVVEDDNGTPGNTADDFNPTFLGGDTNSNNLLDPTETWTYEASGTAVAGQYTNLGTVTADDSGTPVTASDPSNHLGQSDPFASFDIERAEVKFDVPYNEEFKIEGSFVLGAGSNGIDVLTEEVVVTVNEFEETIPAGAFFIDDDGEGFQFDGPPGGIIRMSVRPEGGSDFAFEVEARDIALSTTSTLSISLRISEDNGQIDITLDEDGKFP